MPLFPTEKDIAFFKRRNLEFYKAFFQPIQVLKLIDTAENRSFNETYGENPNQRFAKPYEMPGYIPDLSEWQSNLTRFGVDGLRKLRVFFSPEVAIDLKVELPDIGDRLVIQGDQYKIMQVNPVDYGSNLQIPLSHVVEVARVRPEEPSESGNAIYKDY